MVSQESNVLVVPQDDNRILRSGRHCSFSQHENNSQELCLANLMNLLKRIEDEASISAVSAS